MRLAKVLRDERGFIHKKLLGIVGKVVPSLIPGGSIATGIIGGLIPGVFGGGRGARPGFTSPFMPQIRPESPAEQARRRGISQFETSIAGGRHVGAHVGVHAAPLAKLGIDIPPIEDIIGGIEDLIPGGNGGTVPGIGPGTDLVCEPPLIPNDQGFCEFPGSPAGGVGEARMGRYGAALEPMFQTINKRSCLRGMVLGNDSLCYNKKQLKKSDRMWIPGRRPLLTGGDLNAIATASRAASRFKTQQKRLQDLGMLSKPKARSTPKAVGAGKMVKVLESGPGSVQI